MISTPDLPLKELIYYLEKQIYSDWKDYKNDLSKRNYSFSPNDESFTIELAIGKFQPDLWVTPFLDSKAFPEVHRQVKIAVNNLSIGCDKRSKDKDKLDIYTLALEVDLKRLEELGRKIEPLSKKVNEINDLFNGTIKIYDKKFKNSSSGESNIKDQKIFPANMFLKTKEDILMPLFKELHDAAVNNEVIDKDDTPYKSFLGSFHRSKIKGKIYFRCKNKKAVAFLELIKPIFKEFNARRVEDSQIFYTKGGTLLTQTNYNKSKTKNLTDCFPDLKESIVEILEK